MLPVDVVISLNKCIYICVCKYASVPLNLSIIIEPSSYFVANSDN